MTDSEHGLRLLLKVKYGFIEEKEEAIGALSQGDGRKKLKEMKLSLE